MRSERVIDMRKKFKPYIAVWAVLFALFNICTFVFPLSAERDTSYWIEYVLITLTFLVSPPAVYIIAKNELFNRRKRLIEAAIYLEILLICAVGIIIMTTDVLGIGELIICTAMFLIGIFTLINSALAASMMSYAKKIKNNLEDN